MRTAFCSATHAGRRGEDRTVATRLQWPLAGQACHLFAVFDGHGGSAAARCCAASVVPVVEALLSPAARPPATSPAALASQLQEVVVIACLELHRAFAARGRSGGCTATLALQAGRLVTVGSLGSSRCVLDIGSGGLAALSVDHVISSNWQERQRLAAAGCHVAPVDAAGLGPAPGRHGGGGVLRLWPGGLTLSRSIGDFPTGDGVLPLPHVKQVLLPPSGGRLVLASDGVWSQAGEALLHAMRTAPIRTAALQVVQAAAASAHSDVDASAVVADVLEPGDTWQAVLRRRAEHEAAAEPGGAAPSRRGLGLLRKLSLGRSRRTAEAELQAEPAARQQPLPQQQSAPPAELLADFDPAALLGLLSSKSAAWLWKDRSRSSSFSSSSAHSSSGSASTSGSALVGTDAAALVERAGCRQTPEWWDAQSGRQISACMADARRLWWAKVRSRTDGTLAAQPAGAVRESRQQQRWPPGQGQDRQMGAAAAARTTTFVKLLRARSATAASPSQARSLEPEWVLPPSPAAPSTPGAAAQLGPGAALQPPLQLHETAHP